VHPSRSGRFLGPVLYSRLSHVVEEVDNRGWNGSRTVNEAPGRSGGSFVSTTWSNWYVRRSRAGSGCRSLNGGQSVAAHQDDVRDAGHGSRD